VFILVLPKLNIPSVNHIPQTSRIESGTHETKEATIKSSTSEQIDKAPCMTFTPCGRDIESGNTWPLQGKLLDDAVSNPWSSYINVDVIARMG